MIKKQTAAVEDYLKAVYTLAESGGKATTTALAGYLRVTPASATGMIKKLADQGLVAYRPYHGVKLTRAGRRVALKTLRHHRLIELYLVEQLGVPWDKVHAEADRWEHVISDEIEDRIDQLLGRPTVDPHGAPIPTKAGKVSGSRGVPLNELTPGQSGILREVSDHDSALLRYLGERGLVPGCRVKIISTEPFGGPIIIRRGKVRIALGREIGDHIIVEVDQHK